MKKFLWGVIIFAVGFTFTMFLLPHVAPRSSQVHSTPTGANQTDNTTPNSTPTNRDDRQTNVTYAIPVRLRIPKLKIDAPINLMGLTTGGDMESPVHPQDVGWYKFGSRPGEQGNAVMAGHYGSGSSRGLSVFDDLHTLAKDDTIYTEDAKGTIATFVVSKLQTYAWNEEASEVFQSVDEKAHLNLITCQGTWDKMRQTYSHRLVLFANKK